MPAFTTALYRRAGLACRPSRSVRCLAQQSSVASHVGQMAATAVLTTSLFAAGPAFANGVAFTTPSAGSTVAGPVHVEMSVQGMEIRPAADGLIPGTGHFHVFVDVAEQPEEGEAIPFDDAHKHYGKGQTAADLELAPGKHTLTLQFANALHESYGPQYASSITVDVN